MYVSRSNNVFLIMRETSQNLKICEGSPSSLLVVSQTYPKRNSFLGGFNHFLSFITVSIMYKDLITALTLQIYFDLKTVTQNDLYNVSRIVDLPQCSALSDVKSQLPITAAPFSRDL